MRFFFLQLVLFISFIGSGQNKKYQAFYSFGLDYRNYPIDIEDYPGGGLPNANGLDYDKKFWKVTSFHSRIGVKSEKSWLFSLSGYIRYNHLNWLQGVNLQTSPYLYVENRKNRKKNFKYDLFLDIEKKIRLKKNKERYFTAMAGFGFTNINTRYDVFLRDTLENGYVTPGKRYQGRFVYFGPRISLGYQYKKIKASLDAFVIEDPALTNLTSLWIGATISYEMPLKKNTVKTELYKKPDAAVYYKQSITRKKIGLSLLAPTALLFLLGRMNLDINSPRYGNDRSGFTFAGVVTGGTSLYCLISSRHQLKKAERKNNNPSF